MKRFFCLLRLEIKRTIKAMPRMMAGMVALIIALVGIIFVAKSLFEENTESGGAINIKIAVVSEDDSELFGMAYDMLKNMDSVKKHITLIQTDEKEAEKMLDNGEVMAIMNIPYDVIEGIMNGENRPIEVKFNKNAGYEATAFKELADAAVNMLATSQAGIYSVYDFYKEHRHKNQIQDAWDRLNKEYITTVVLREKLFFDVKLCATDDVPVEEYYIISAVVLFMLLFGINQISHVEPYKKEMIKALAYNKTGVVKQVCARIFAMTVMYIIIHTIFLTGYGIIKGISLLSYIRYFLSLIIIEIVISSIVVFMQVITKNRQAAVMGLFFVTVIQGFLSGCFVPKIMLPQAINEIAEFMPVHYMIKQLKSVYLGSDNMMQNIFMLLIMFLIITVADILVLKHEKDR